MDIIERLHDSPCSGDIGCAHKLCVEAADEIERLRNQLRHQEHRDGRVGTHSADCYGFGPSHYECALREIERLHEELEDMHRRERSTAIQHLGNEGQWCDLLDAKDKVIERLQEALDQVLDDMGAEGRSVCGATKAQVRYALGYKVDPDFDHYTLDHAISVLVEVGEFGTKEEAYAALKEGE